MREGRGNVVGVSLFASVVVASFVPVARVGPLKGKEGVPSPPFFCCVFGRDLPAVGGGLCFYRLEVF